MSRTGAGLSRPAGEPPAPPGRGSAADLLALQRLAWSSIIISATRRCPLRCRHCITRSGPDASEPLLGVELARRWAAELPALARQGLRHLTFTGGEPVLALDAVALLSAAAAREGIGNYVVTSAAWASTPATARRIVQRLATVSRWDIGFDEYHGEWMPLQRLQQAVDALEEAGASYVVRVCGAADGPAMRSLREVVGARGTLVAQPVRAIGRAADGAALQAAENSLPHLPCMSTGLFVRADGSTGPCCSGLAYEAGGVHPFDYGSAQDAGGMQRAWRAWRADPLLRLLRLAGFGAIEGWLREDGVIQPGESFPRDPCEACVALWTRRPQAGSLLAAHARRPGTEARLDALEQALYGEVWSHGA